MTFGGAKIAYKVKKKNNQKGVKMENWREKIVHGDISEAARRAGVGRQWYGESLRIPVVDWEKRHIAINKALKEIVEEREAYRATFMAEREARQKQECDAN